jgi:hypothetical protein
LRPGRSTCARPAGSYDCRQPCALPRRPSPARPSHRRLRAGSCCWAHPGRERHLDHRVHLPFDKLRTGNRRGRPRGQDRGRPHHRLCAGPCCWPDPGLAGDHQRPGHQLSVRPRWFDCAHHRPSGAVRQWDVGVSRQRWAGQRAATGRPGGPGGDELQLQPVRCAAGGQRRRAIRVHRGAVGRERGVGVPAGTIL